MFSCKLSMELDNINKHADEADFASTCTNYQYLPAILPSKERIIVIGDIHGDYNLAVECLRIAKLIDDNMNWIGGNTVVVQVGDQLDNCRPFDKKCNDPMTDSNITTSSHNHTNEAEDVKVLNFFTEMHNKAAKQGGMVISLIGNHEIMNVMGNFNYVSYNDVDKFKNYKDPNDPDKKFATGEEGRRHAFARGNEYAKIMACTRVSSIIIGDFLFTHAGVVPKFADKLNIKSKKDLYKLNYHIRRWLLGLINKDYIADIVNSSSYSIFWDRILGSLPPSLNNNDPKCVEYLDPVLQLFKVGHMIIGHTPQYFINKDGINETCNKKLWRVDIGGSFGFNAFDNKYTNYGKMVDVRNAQVLEIIDNKIIRVIKKCPTCTLKKFCDKCKLKKN